MNLRFCGQQLYLIYHHYYHQMDYIERMIVFKGCIWIRLLKIFCQYNKRFSIYFFFSPVTLRNNSHTSLYKFHVYNMIATYLLVVSIRSHFSFSKVSSFMLIENLIITWTYWGHVLSLYFWLFNDTHSLCFTPMVPCQHLLFLLVNLFNFITLVGFC